MIINYFRYDTIIPWMEQLAADNPSFVTLTDMGRWGEIDRFVGFGDLFLQVT